MAKKRGLEFLFIPAGLFIGMGVGFIYPEHLVADMFIGLGIGFLITALFRVIKKK
jgi:hypothetical protein